MSGKDLILLSILSVSLYQEVLGAEPIQGIHIGLVEAPEPANGSTVFHDIKPG